jgi:hypothetical protein
MVFVDASAWFAFFVAADPNHDRVIRWHAGEHERPVTTDFCVDETLTLLEARGELRRAVEAGRWLIEGNRAELHFVTPRQFHRAWILFQQRASAGWSFTDCTSKVVMDDLGIKTAVALDVHFQSFGVAVVP